MSYEGGLNSLVADIREASQNLTAGDARMNQRLDGIERSVNETLPEARPSRRQLAMKDEEISERKDAVKRCQNRRALTVPKKLTLAFWMTTHPRQARSTRR